MGSNYSVVNLKRERERERESFTTENLVIYVAFGVGQLPYFEDVRIFLMIGYLEP